MSEERAIRAGCWYLGTQNLDRRFDREIASSELSG